MKKNTVIGFTATFLMFVIATIALAALPQTMSYQGYLTNGSGTAINAPTAMTFSLYSSNPHRNNPVWKETQPSVAVSNGVYNVQIGSVAPITAKFDVPYWLGIKVGNDPEMTPLQTLATNSYAFMAQNVIGTSPGFTNFIIGRNAGNSTMTGSGNTSVGVNAFQENTTGNYNTIAGTSALRTNTTGNANSAFGYHSLQSSTDGSWNTALGFYSLFSNTAGVGNTASGNNGLFTNTTGVYNTANGKDALYFNTTGNYNTASGFSSLIDNTTGNNNTAVGLLSGSSNTSGFRNTFIGANSVPANPDLVNATAIGANAVVGASNSMVLGGTGVNAVKVGIGTSTPSQPLEVVGTVKATSFVGDGSGLTGLPVGGGSLTAVTASAPLASSGGTTPVISLGTVGVANGGTGLTTSGVAGQYLRSNGTAWTSAAVQSFDLPTGSVNYLQNQTLSAQAASFNISGNGMIGGNLLLPTTTTTTGFLMSGGSRLIHTYPDSSNFFAGINAGNLNMTGTNNTGNGMQTLSYNTTGFRNTANGTSALQRNSSGNENTGVGYVALFKNTTGSDNTSVGSWALNENTTGAQNTAYGAYALPNNTSGINNTAIGYNALQSTTVSNWNTAVGVSAGHTWDNGSNNTFIGASADSSMNNLNNSTAIGANAVVDASNQVRIGNASVTQIGGQVPWTNPSDIRLKTDVRDISAGLAFIKALKPVEYKMKKGNNRNDFGFIAQDVETLIGSEYNILSIGGDTDRTLSLRYTDFIAPMVKAMQEQQKLIEDQKETIDSQKQQIKTLEERLSQIESLLTGK